MRNQSVIYSLLLELIIAPTFENRDVNYYCRYWITRFEVCLLMVSIQKCNCIQKQRCRERGGPGGQRPLEFGRSVNSIQTRGAGYAPHTTASPPRFKKVSTPLRSIVLTDEHQQKCEVNVYYCSSPNLLSFAISSFFSKRHNKLRNKAVYYHFNATLIHYTITNSIYHYILRLYI